MTDRVLVLGGYGVFGGRLAQGLLRDQDATGQSLEVLVAGRSLSSARAFCHRHGGTAVALDRAAPDRAVRIAELKPRVVIDAAGPFQSYGDDPYALARAAIACRAHYIDLADDADFATGIAALNTDAKAAGVAVISGASSVPGLSSAVVTELADGFQDIVRIESTILPGNRAPRGLSVIRAILAQAGQPVTMWMAGRGVTVPGWSAHRREVLELVGVRPLRRWASFIGAPDLDLFPPHFKARTVTFRAGLELPVLHFGLWLASLPVRWRLIRSLEPLAGPIRRLAQMFEPFGSDRGGMVVRVLGRCQGRHYELRSWTLIAEAGDGPHIPALAARILCAKAITGALVPGARACVSQFELADVTGVIRDLKVTTGRVDRPIVPVFRQALGERHEVLPEPVRALHECVDCSIWHGQASVQTGSSVLAALVRRLIGFPGQGAAIPVTVEIRRCGDGEQWLRDFGGKRFRSELKLFGTLGGGRVTERFGPFRFVIALNPGPTGLGFPVERGWCLGLPLPSWLLPRSQSVESAGDGLFRFDVAVCLPLVGLIVRYIGWLQPRSEDKS